AAAWRARPRWWRRSCGGASGRPRRSWSTCSRSPGTRRRPCRRTTAPPCSCARSATVRAKRSLGQNFLVDPNIQRRIVAALELRPEDEVLEIGPGTGALTRHLAAQAGRVVAIEKDDDLAAALQAEFEGAAGVTRVHGDALEADLASLVQDPERVKVVGNIPYNITSPLLFHLLESGLRAERIVVMVQREVADRLLASPGEKAYGALTVGVRTAADVRRLFHVGRAAFRPVPDVDSTVIMLVPHRPRSEEHTSELQSRENLVCRL